MTYECMLNLNKLKSQESLLRMETASSIQANFIFSPNVKTEKQGVAWRKFERNEKNFLRQKVLPSRKTFLLEKGFLRFCDFKADFGYSWCSKEKK